MPRVGNVAAIQAARRNRKATPTRSKAATPVKSSSSSSGMFDSFVERAGKVATAASTAAQKGLKAAKGNALHGLGAAKEKLNGTSGSKQATTTGAAARPVATAMQGSSARRSDADRETVQLLVDLGIERDDAVKALRDGTADTLVEAALANEADHGSESSASTDHVSRDVSQRTSVRIEHPETPVVVASPAARAAAADAAERRLALNRGRGIGTMDDWRRQRAEYRRGASSSASGLGQETVASQQQQQQQQQQQATTVEGAEEEVHMDEIMLQRALAESCEAEQMRRTRAMGSCCAAAMPGEDTTAVLFETSAAHAEGEHDADLECFSQSCCAAAPPAGATFTTTPLPGVTPASMNLDMEVPLVVETFTAAPLPDAAPASKNLDMEAPPFVETFTAAPLPDTAPASKSLDMEVAVPIVVSKRAFVHLASVGTWLRAKPF